MAEQEAGRGSGVRYKTDEELAAELERASKHRDLPTWWRKTLRAAAQRLEDRQKHDEAPIPIDVAQLAADGCEVRADELSDAASEAYEGWDEERGEHLQRRAGEYRRAVKTIREALLRTPTPEDTDERE